MKPHRQFRDQHNGQFGFDGDFDRVCICGHRLGVHGPAGVECLAGTNVPDDPNPRGVECECTKFRPVREKRVRRKSNPGAGAEPATSVQPASGSDQVGRTGGSNPPTGAPRLPQDWVEKEDAKQIGREALRSAGLPHSPQETE